MVQHLITFPYVFVSKNQLTISSICLLYVAALCAVCMSTSPTLPGRRAERWRLAASAEKKTEQRTTEVNERLCFPAHTFLVLSVTRLLWLPVLKNWLTEWLLTGRPHCAVLCPINCVSRNRGIMALRLIHHTTHRSTVRSLAQILTRHTIILSAFPDVRRRSRLTLEHLVLLHKTTDYTEVKLVRCTNVFRFFTYVRTTDSSQKVSACLCSVPAPHTAWLIFGGI